VYDAPTNSLIMFGGDLYADTSNDLKLLSNANGIGTSDWVTVIPDGAPNSPPARAFQTAGYDAANSRMIVFGGCTGAKQSCSTYVNEVWVLANANGLSGSPMWAQLAPAGTPPVPRIGQTTAYDPTTNSLIVFGGQDSLGSELSDTWVLTNANGMGGQPAWTQLVPSGGPPTGQDFGTTVYDAADNVLIEFGGLSQSASATNSVWTLSHANGSGGPPVWTNLIRNGAGGSIGKRYGQIAAYDGANNRMIVFGGDSDNSRAISELNDVWVLSNANGLSGTAKWSKLSISGSKPSPRVLCLGAYDSADNRLIIHGGISSDGGFFSPWVLTDANGLP
jgi:hypothetical protein